MATTHERTDNVELSINSVPGNQLFSFLLELANIIILYHRKGYKYGNINPTAIKVVKRTKKEFVDPGEVKEERSEEPDEKSTIS